jgi:hypothetical protein
MRLRSVRARIVAMANENPRIVIALSAGGAAPSGQVEIDGEEGRPFRGWLALLAELGRAFERGDAAPAADQAEIRQAQIGPPSGRPADRRRRQ